MLGVSSIVLRAAGCQVGSLPETYDDWVADFGSSVVSYWKFASDGVDQKGTESAVIFGSPELEIETIVDLDTIAEGAPTDGTCIAWPGSAGTYAEVPHNPAHKTPEGTIVVSFQRDSLIAKSTLVAADRPLSGATSGPGGFSIEVQPDGAPRCFMRRQSDGAPVVMVGESGDVARNQAYTMIFKWGPAGLSMALWDENGTLVRRRTNALTDGVTGTSPIRFGIWHNGTSSPHDGPFARIIWLDHQISETREADLARARTIVRSPAGSGDYEPFPFVTSRMPAVSHAGCSDRPSYVAHDPRSASFIDPMSGLEIFRITGDLGSDVLLNGSTNSGVDFPRNLKPENNPVTQRDWNADGTLLMLPESKGRSGDPSSPCRSALISVTGTHMSATAPWQIIRAASSVSLGDFSNVKGWMWDNLNPLRAYHFKSNGCYEWWPAGGAGHSVGEINFLFPWPSGYSDWDSPGGGTKQSDDGVYYHAPVRRNSDGAWGGIRINLITGEADDFWPHPLNYTNDERLGVQPTGCRGEWAFFNHAVQSVPTTWQSINMITGQRGQTVSQVAGHPDHTQVDGKEYGFGFREGFWRLYDFELSQKVNKAADTGSVTHGATKGRLDTFEVNGATGGSTSGHRYALCCVSSPQSRAGIVGLRLGANDDAQWRYICHHRSVRSENTSEVHPQQSPDWRYVVFNSNWLAPGVASSNNVSSYVVVIPDGWRSPNNDGS